MVVLLSIDGLWIWSMDDVEKNRKRDIWSNTYKSISSAYKSEFFEKINISNIVNPIHKKYDQLNISNWFSELWYDWADSFIGHNCMIWNTISNSEKYFLEWYLDKIISVFNDEFEIKYENNVLYLWKNIVVANNIESDLWMNINILGDLKEVDFNKLKEVWEKIREIINPFRVIVMWSKFDNFQKSVSKNINSITIDWIVSTWVNIPWTGAYSKDYRVFHMSKIFEWENLLTICKRSEIKTLLIWKTNDIFWEMWFDWFSSSITNEVIRWISDWLQNRIYDFIFANIQWIDLAWHSEDLEESISVMKDIDKNINLVTNKMQEKDILITTADHWNDPLIWHSYHTRENVPIFILSEKNKAGNIWKREWLFDIWKTILDIFNIKNNLKWSSFYNLL